MSDTEWARGFQRGTIDGLDSAISILKEYIDSQPAKPNLAFLLSTLIAHRNAQASKGSASG